jgi:hypothetical protein
MLLSSFEASFCDYENTAVVLLEDMPVDMGDIKASQ